jgi:hypothetical protein
LKRREGRRAAAWEGRGSAVEQQLWKRRTAALEGGGEKHLWRERRRVEKQLGRERRRAEKEGCCSGGRGGEQQLERERRRAAAREGWEESSGSQGREKGRASALVGESTSLASPVSVLCQSRAGGTA